MTFLGNDLAKGIKKKSFLKRIKNLLDKESQKDIYNYICFSWILVFISYIIMLCFYKSNGLIYVFLVLGTSFAISIFLTEELRR